VGDLERDTRVTPVAGAEGRYTAKLSADWAIWGPNGGYVASVALRAAGLATGRARPASIFAHFLSVARFETVDIETAVLKASRVATSVRVSMRQGDRPILDGMVWAVDAGAVALDHDTAPAPDVVPPDELPTFAERLAAVPPDAPAPAPFPFFANLDHRALDWRPEWPPPGPVEPRARLWLRFVPTARFDEPWADACRLLVPIDTYGWPAAHRAHAYKDPLPAVGVTVDLSARFHRPTSDEWLLVEVVSPIAGDGLVAATGRLWDRSGALLASGEQTMLCRPTSYAGPPADPGGGSGS
jgi:acyl-CoA thioesterase II